jgi:hypothetical protein
MNLPQYSFKFQHANAKKWDEQHLIDFGSRPSNGNGFGSRFAFPLDKSLFCNQAPVVGPPFPIDAPRYLARAVDM